MVGIGVRSGVRLDDVLSALNEGLAALSESLGQGMAALGGCLPTAQVQVTDVIAVGTTQARAGEPAVIGLAGRLGVPLVAWPAEVLARQAVPNPSATVGRLAGTSSVAEAAVLASGAELLLPKRIASGVTVAFGRFSRAAEALAELHDRDAGAPPTVMVEGPAARGGAGAPPTVMVEDPAARSGVGTSSIMGVEDLFRDGVRTAPGFVAEDLGHHGDAETGPGLVDLAVNVRAAAPEWLRARLRKAVDGLAAYPDPDRATAVVARRHGRPVEQVLLTSGAAEAFVLLARVLGPRLAVVVHPQFTEPEAALRAAGHRVHRVLLPPPFTLRPDLVPDEADLVFVGNPTNPTSVLHPAADLLALRRPGRLLVVDEAFMDAVPGEPESLAGADQSDPTDPTDPAGPAGPADLNGPAHVAGPVGSAGQADPAGLVVIRSLTKTWGLAGLRIGYLLGDPEVLAACRRAQPLWSVGSIALEAAIACSSPAAAIEAQALARDAVLDREYLLDRLAEVPFVRPAAGSRAPFVLLRVSGPDPGGVHGRLRAAGWAVRRADTFPGLGTGWLRVAVRDQATTDAFVPALTQAITAARRPFDHAPDVPETSS